MMGTLTSDMLSSSLLISASSRVFIKKDYEASKNTSLMRKKKKPTVYFYLLSKYSAKFALQLNKYLKLPIILARKAKLLGAL